MKSNPESWTSFTRRPFLSHRRHRITNLLLNHHPPPPEYLLRWDCTRPSPTTTGSTRTNMPSKGKGWHWGPPAQGLGPDRERPGQQEGPEGNCPTPSALPRNGSTPKEWRL